MENDDQTNEDTNTEQAEDQQESQIESTEGENSPEEQDDKPSRARRKKGPCPDCVKNGVSTGLQDASTLCPTCAGSGSV